MEDTDLTLSQTVVAAPKKVKINEQETNEAIILQTTKMELVVRKQPWITIKDVAGHVLENESERGMAYRENGEVIVFKDKDKQDHFYGFGEKSGYLDKCGEKYEMWNSDVYAPHNPETDALYQSIPFFMTLRNGNAHGLFLITLEKQCSISKR